MFIIYFHLELVCSCIEFYFWQFLANLPPASILHLSRMQLEFAGYEVSQTRICASAPYLELVIVLDVTASSQAASLAHNGHQSCWLQTAASRSPTHDCNRRTNALLAYLERRIGGGDQRISFL